MAVPVPTPRLRFRKYRLADAASVSTMFADPLARRFYPGMVDREASERWIRWYLDNYATHGFGLWAVESAETGAFLGDCGLTYQVVEGEEVLEVGYHLMADQRGNGYATEAARACVSYVLDELGAEMVCSIVDATNEASLRVASRLHHHRRSFTLADGRAMELFWTATA